MKHLKGDENTNIIFSTVEDRFLGKDLNHDLGTPMSRVYFRLIVFVVDSTDVKI